MSDSDRQSQHPAPHLYTQRTAAAPPDLCSNKLWAANRHMGGQQECQPLCPTLMLVPFNLRLELEVIQHSHARYKAAPLHLPPLILLLAPLHELCIWLGVMRPALLCKEILHKIPKGQHNGSWSWLTDKVSLGEPGCCRLRCPCCISDSSGRSQAATLPVSADLAGIIFWGLTLGLLMA